MAPRRWRSRRAVKRRGRKWGKRKGAFKRRGLKTTLRGGRKGYRRHRMNKFKKRFHRGKNTSFRAIAKRVRQIPIPQLDTIYDDMHAGFTNTQGVDSWECMGANDQTARAITAGLTCSADNIIMKLTQINSGSVVPTGWALGRSAAIITSWEQKMRWNNISNQPLKITLYTLRCRQDIPAVWWTLNLGTTNNILDLMETAFDDQYGSTIAANRTIGHIAFKLTDIALFRRYFKIVKITSFTIQPGQEKVMRKYKNKPEYLNTTKFYQPQVGFPNCAKKGNREYLWRIHSTTTESKDQVGASRTTPAYNFQTSYHYRVRYLAHDQYNFQPPAAPTAGLTLHTIYPGTSTVGDLVPAT